MKTIVRSSIFDPPPEVVLYYRRPIHNRSTYDDFVSDADGKQASPRMAERKSRGPQHAVQVDRKDDGHSHGLHRACYKMDLWKGKSFGDN